MQSWYLPFGLGVLCLIGAAIGFMNPVQASLLAGSIIAWTFLLIGVACVLSVFQAGPILHRLLAGAIGVIFTLIALSLLANPLVGLIQLTVVVAVLFIFSGVLKAMYAFSFRGTPFFWGGLLSGVASAAIGFLALINFPVSAAVMLGVLLAVELASSGAALVSFALTLRAGLAADAVS